MTETILLINGLTPLQTWGLIALVVFALAGVWSLLSLYLDWLNDWLNEREYDAQYRVSKDYEERRLRAWTDAQEKFKAGRRVQ